MNAPQVITRELTFNFIASVTDQGVPDLMEVALLPLQNAADVAAGGTFAGGLKTAKVELSEPVNSVSFHLIPSYSPGLTTPVPYRVMWRAGITGRTYSYDFAMPDQDLTWEQLASEVGDIIDGEAYLQHSDLGVPNRVARLNADGHVVDAAGILVASSTDLTALQNDLNVEKVTRAAAVNSLNASLQAQIDTQVDATLSSAKAYTDNQVVSLETEIANERGSRINADDDLQTQIDTAAGTLSTLSSSYATFSTNTTATLATKADLSGGKVPLAQIPDSAITKAFSVANQTAMLALSSSVVAPGDIAVRPDGTWMLTATDPTILGNWTLLTPVNSVNGYRGAVILSASDVGAIATGASINQGQVTGLTTALNAKANQTDLNTLSSSVTGILNDTTIVKTVSGVVPTSLMSADMVQINGSGQLVKKDGTIISLGSGGSGAVFSVNGQTGIVVLNAASVGAISTSATNIGQSQITGLTTALAAKADLSGGTVPTGQIPSLAISKVTGLQTALDSKPTLSGGVLDTSVIPTLAQSKVTGLVGLVSGNQLTSSTNAINRIASLETRVTTVEGGGGGGGGGTTSTSVFYDSATLTDPVTNFTDVILHSPWGIDSDGTITGTINAKYYLRTGVRSQDVAYPFISANGHLSLRKWDEGGAADPVYALQSDLSTLTTTVGTKAAQSDLNTLTTTVGTKASQSALNALSTTVDGKASQADLTALTTTVGTKANQSSLDSTNATLATKANQSALDATNATVATKANQSSLDTTNTNVAANTTALSTKADLSGGVLASAQIPNVPQNKVTGLVTALAAKADLDGSNKILVSQLPSIPQSSVTNLGTTLAAKADLDGSGKVPMNQIPLGALPNVAVVANRAAMLALTTSQVQYGDMCLITATADAGTYVLVASDPSVFSNWMALTTSAAAPVISVNGQTGVVALTYSDVGAMSATATGIPQSSIAGLTTTLATFATTTAMNTALGNKVEVADLRAMWYGSSMVKRADYVATGNISGLSGFKTADGVLMPSGAIVLLTAQTDSKDNGLWTVSGSTWQRAADYASGSLMAKDTIIIVANQTASANGSTNPNTIWQCSAMVVGASAANVGFVDNAATSWTRIGYTATPYAPTQGNGVSITGSTFSVNAATTITNPADITKTLAGGVVSASGGIYVDPNNVPRKYLGTVPSGSTNAVINHNLANPTPTVSIWDTATGAMVLAGVQATSANSVTIEFASAPSSGQYKVCVVG